MFDEKCTSLDQFNKFVQPYMNKPREKGGKGGRKWHFGKHDRSLTGLWGQSYWLHRAWQSATFAVAETFYVAKKRRSQSTGIRHAEPPGDERPGLFTRPID
jgi:hypothetical protein